MDEENIQRTIIFYATQTLRTITFCYRDFNSCPPRGVEHDEQDKVCPFFSLWLSSTLAIINGLIYRFLTTTSQTILTLIAITGIEDPIHDGVHKAVAKCHKAGIINAKALVLPIPVGSTFPSRSTIASTLLIHVKDPKKKETLVDFLIRLYSVYVDLHFAYLEINPLICLDAVDANSEPTVHYLLPGHGCEARPDGGVNLRCELGDHSGPFDLRTSSNGCQRKRIEYRC